MARTAPGLVAHWDFDDGGGTTLHDRSGNGHHGRISGAAWVEGTRGGALQFDGKDDHVEIPLTDALNITGDMSLLCFFRTASDDARDRLIYGDANSLAVDRNLSVGLDRGKLFVGHADGHNYEVTSPGVRFTGTWRHLGLVFQRTHAYIYLDGELVDQTSMSVPTEATKPANRYIGGWWAGRFLGAIDDMKLFDRAVTDDEILTHQHGRATRADPMTVIEPSLRLTRRQLRVTVTMRNVAAPPATIDLHVRPAIRQPLQVDGLLAGRATATATFDLSGVPPGEYELRCGELAATTVRVPETPPWFGTDVGKAGRPPPFTPVQRDGNVVRVIGREYRLTEAGLIAQVAAAGEELLARPMRFSTDGEVTCKAEVDYDGLVMMRCRLKGYATRLALEVPVRPSHARYLHVWAGHAKHSGNRPSRYATSFAPVLWLGDDRRGMSFLCESPQHWMPADPDRAIEIVEEDGAAVLRLNLVGRPRTGGEFVFAFHATPVKPIRKDGWDTRIGVPPDYGFDYDLLTKPIEGENAITWLAGQGVATLLATNWTDVMTYPWPIGKEDEFRALIERCHANGIRVVPYLGYQINEAAPEYAAMRDEVIRLPKHASPDIYPGMKDPQMVNTVCLRSVWTDALAWYVDRMMREYDIDGVYLDSPNMPFACTNEAHGCGYRDAGGKLRPTYPVFAVREAFRRLYSVVKTHKPDGIVDSHVYDCMNSGTLSFATSYWNGEQLGHAEHGAEGLPLDRFRAEMMGVNWGVPADFLHYRLGDYNTACAIALLHDVTVRSYTLQHKKINGALYRLAADFGRAEATFKPYWTKPVPDVPVNCHASVYEHPRNGRLVLVSNLGREKATVSVAGESVVDGLTREPVRDGRVDLEPMGWRYLWVARAQPGR